MLNPTSAFRWALCVASLCVCSAATAQDVVHRSPSGDRYVELNAEGATILPNGRIITPEGRMLRIQPHPYGMAISPDGRWIVTANSGRPISLSVLDLADPANPALTQIPSSFMPGTVFRLPHTLKHLIVEDRRDPIGPEPPR